MAKKKSPPKAPAKDARAMIVQFKGSEEYRGWVEELAEKFRTSNVGMIDRALAEFAQRNGFREPPKR